MDNDGKNNSATPAGPEHDKETTTTKSTSVHPTTTNQTTMNDTTPSLLSTTTMANTSQTTLTNNNETKTVPNVLSSTTTTIHDMMMTRKSKEKPEKKLSPNNTKQRRGEDLVTVADLEELLRAGGYVRESDLSSFPSSPQKSSSANTNNVAMPQSSVLSYRGLTIGTTLSSGFLSMILSLTISPNLWLIGMILGALYGYQVSQDYKDNSSLSNNDWVLSNLAIGMGRRVAKMYLVVYDFCRGIWFLYKTGQLSYEYYKQYSKWDERFGIGDKMDAWNARFVEGKKKFDAWEQEHEVSRRMLAMLRTAWLVEQQQQTSLKQRTKSSRYRIVQYGYDGMAWLNRMWTALWNAIIGGGNSPLRQVLRGIRMEILSEWRVQEMGPRMGSALVALITVSMVGAVFAIAPKLLGALAIIIGFVIWPTWVTEFGIRFSSLLDEWKQKGDDSYDPEEDDGRITTTRTTTALRLSSQFGMYDTKRYHYYRRKDGSKKWYRTGRPAFRSDQQRDKSDEKGWWFGSGPTSSNKDKTKNGKGGGKKAAGKTRAKTSGKPQWGLFGW